MVYNIVSYLTPTPPPNENLFYCPKVLYRLMPAMFWKLTSLCSTNVDNILCHGRFHLSLRCHNHQLTLMLLQQHLLYISASDWVLHNNFAQLRCFNSYFSCPSRMSSAWSIEHISTHFNTSKANELRMHVTDKPQQGLPPSQHLIKEQT